MGGPGWRNSGEKQQKRGTRVTTDDGGSSGEAGDPKFSPHKEDCGVSGYRYVAELVWGHPVAVGRGITLLHGRSDVDGLWAQDLGGGKWHRPPVSPPGTNLQPLGHEWGWE